jgi:spermidine synthase
LGIGIGLLYFVNTLGAAIGCFLAGFVLLPRLGLTRTTLVAFAGNAFVATVAFALDRATPPRERTDADESAATSPEGLLDPPWWPYAVAFGSGFAGLAFEVVWFRVLVMVFGSTVYSFSAMLSVFLLGLAIGSIGGELWPIEHGYRFACSSGPKGDCTIFALGGACSQLDASAVPAHARRRRSRLFGNHLTKFVLSMIVLLPAALFFGATFPIVVKLAPAMGRGTGSRVGRVYVWNTMGAILDRLARASSFSPRSGWSAR